jgi:hypothetical protein
VLTEYAAFYPSFFFVKKKTSVRRYAFFFSKKTARIGDAPLGGGSVGMHFFFQKKTARATEGAPLFRGGHFLVFQKKTALHAPQYI